MHKGTWVTVVVCGLLGGCTDLAFLFRPTPPITLSAGEPEVETTKRLHERPARRLPPQKVAQPSQPSQPALAETSPSATRVDPLTTGATEASPEGRAAAKMRADNEWIARREREAKRATSGICTGC